MLTDQEVWDLDEVRRTLPVVLFSWRCTLCARWSLVNVSDEGTDNVSEGGTDGWTLPEGGGSYRMPSVQSMVSDDGGSYGLPERGGSYMMPSLQSMGSDNGGSSTMPSDRQCMLSF